MAANGDAPLVLRSDSPGGSPRTASTSLHAAATVNAGLQHETSQASPSSSLPRSPTASQSSRRRSQLHMNLQLNDPTLPSPGEMAHESSGRHSSIPQHLPVSPGMADPHHHRAPSLGELHQELEAEQEAHVNRLLQMIRQQQLELQRLQSSHPQHSQGNSIDDSSAVAERSMPSTPQAAFSQASIPSGPPTGSYPRSPSFPRPRNSFDMARADLHRRSRTPSRGASPRVRSGSISAESGDWITGGRDESAFYQAETQMLTRENQMLRHRIRDLEKQLSETSGAVTAGASASNEPAASSNLTQSETIEEVS